MAKWWVQVKEKNTYRMEVEAEDSADARNAALDAVRSGEAKPYDGDLYVSEVERMKP